LTTWSSWRTGPSSWCARRRGARGRDTSSTRTCSLRSGRRVMDTAALVDALGSKRIAGAGLDVLEGEHAVPPILSELLQFENVGVTPHCAGRAPEARTAATALILANLNAHFTGKPLPSPVSLAKT